MISHPIAFSFWLVWFPMSVGDVRASPPIAGKKLHVHYIFGWSVAIKCRETNWRLWMSSAIQDKCPPSGLVEENDYFYW
jgi:hypothetical protein